MGKKDTIHFAATEKGWTSNEIGLQWLTTIFNRYTKEKRGKRLLLIDGHSSHINMAFFDGADSGQFIGKVFFYLDRHSAA